MSELIPSCCTVNCSRFIDILRNSLKSGNVNDRVHCNRLPCTYDYNCDPCHLCTGQHTRRKCLTSKHFSESRKNVCKEIVENISYNQCSENIWNEVCTTECTLEFDLAVQPKRQDQTDYICHDRSYNCKFKCKQIRATDSAVCKKILIISKSYPVKASITFEIRKTVNHTFDQWQCIKTEKQCHDWNCYQKKGHFSSTH